MTIEHEWVVLDTNVWIFGLRHQTDQPACADLLRFLHRLLVKGPRQVVLELYGNLLVPFDQSLSRPALATVALLEHLRRATGRAKERVMMSL